MTLGQSGLSGYTAEREIAMFSQLAAGATESLSPPRVGRAGARPAAAGAARDRGGWARLVSR